jgi:hypothetical protein
MNWTLPLVAATMVGCATSPPDPAALARQHERNVDFARRLGYEVVTDNGRTRFCATQAPTASHIVPPCMDETQWMLVHPDTGGSPSVSSGTVKSGRSSVAGTLGY